MHIAIEGCCHGCLDEIYSSLETIEKQKGKKIDLLIICGDMETMRNQTDMEFCLNCPPKYKHMGDFHKYYSGAVKAPVLTIFIGGNHESSNYLQELCYGGWVAPNIYYLGYSNVIRVGGLRIAGLSGIYNKWSYKTGHHEVIPYNDQTLRSVYQVKQCEVEKLRLLSSKELSGDVIDIFISHDWPNSIEKYGDTERLLKFKPYFREESQNGTLGSPPNMELLKLLQPRHWFSAHMHVKFFATVQHLPQTETNGFAVAAKPKAIKVADPNSIDIDDNDDGAELQEEETVGNTDASSSASITNEKGSEEEISTFEKEAQSSSSSSSSNSLKQKGPKVTQFMALDKCLPKRQYLHVMEINAQDEGADKKEEIFLSYDEDWLAILRATHTHVPTNEAPQTRHDQHYYNQISLENERKYVRKAFLDRSEGKNSDHLEELYRIPENFSVTAPVHTPKTYFPLTRLGNPQTDLLLETLKLPHHITIPWKP